MRFMSKYRSDPLVTEARERADVSTRINSPPKDTKRALHCKISVILNKRLHFVVRQGLEFVHLAVHDVFKFVGEAGGRL